MWATGLVGMATKFVLLIPVGAVLKLERVRNSCDISNGLMAIPRLLSVLGLSGLAAVMTKDYFAKDKVRIRYK